MPVLVINCGSTSIKAAVLDGDTGQRFGEFMAERLGSSEAVARVNDDETSACPSEHGAALQHCLSALLSRLNEKTRIDCVGHRVVHGGPEFTKPTLLNDKTVAAIDAISHLAPLHNPANVAGIEVTRRILPDIPQVAVFDTAFHGTMPRRAKMYALPQDLANKHAIRRFGFHGTSHEFVARRAAAFLNEDIRNLRIISCHLGGGCSVCAIENGRSVETSMGMTPLEGLVMGTRSGDIDPGAILHLMREGKMDADSLDDLLNRQSGLAGLSGIGSSDLRDIEQRAEEGNEDCRLAIQVFCHRVRKYVGAYAAVMGGVDAIVFTAGIGQNSAVVRHRIAQRMQFLGARIDEDRNREAGVNSENPVADLSALHSRVRLLAVQTDEAWAIASQTSTLYRSLAAKPIDRIIPVAISARHIHLTQETVEALFGDGHELTPLKPLSQPGQFAAAEEVTLIGPKRTIEGVRVLGPIRSKDQVEISRTDEFYLGIDAPIRASGDIENTPGITLEGTAGRRVTLQQGVICAWRHIHMTPDDAAEFEVQNGDIVEVEVGKPGLRSLTFGDVLVRVKPTYKLEMHIDTDEGNAAELARSDTGELEITDGRAILQKSRR